MSEDRQELLFAMMLKTREEAHAKLSEEGREVLRMMDYASRNAGLSILEAYVEARATARLSDHDRQVINAYLARRTLIEAFEEQGEEEIGNG